MTEKTVDMRETSARGQITTGSARFTAVTPECIRIEYSESGVFTDQPTMFATNRAVRCATAEISTEDGSVLMDTGRIRLRYSPDGKPFHPGNLKAWIINGSTDVEWEPGKQNTQNLGGPITTLDGVHGEVPLSEGLLARDGWYLLDDSKRPVLADGWISQQPLSASSSIDWYLFGYGTDFKAAFAALAAVSGRVPMPRKHVHGSWYCRWYPYTAKDFLQIVQEYREHDFPLDILVMDMDWHAQDADYGYGHAGNRGWTGYTWNRKLIPDPDALLTELRQQGVFVTVNDHPHDGIRDHEECYPEFMAKLGLTPGKGRNVPFNAGDAAYMNAYFEAAHEPLERQGIDFWWVDWQQDYIYPYVLGVPELRHLPWLNYLYFGYSRKNDRRGQGFSRWGGWGDHRHPIQFSGDSGTKWEMLAFEVPFTLASGNAGCFFWAHDIGGFHGERDPETYARWVQFGALSSSLRLHSAGEELDRRPWLWGQPFEDSMRTAFHFRSRLFPYIYTSIRQCYDRTVPLTRPMYLEYPEREEAYQCRDQYMFGDHLLVAPIVGPGEGPDLTADRKVWFPEGTWFSMFTGQKFDGPAWATVSAGIMEIPVFARGGVPIPMQPYTHEMATAPLETLIIRCYPGESGECTLYEDDGQSEGYTRGECARTSLSYSRDDGGIKLWISPASGRYAGQVESRGYKIELACTDCARSVLVNGQTAEFEYDAVSKTNIVAVSRRSIAEGVEILVVADDVQAAGH